MYNDDYIIAIDENGQPYIAHAFGDGYRRAKAKYLDKVRTKSGAWRYLYTPEEVAALGRERRAKKAGVKDTKGLQEYQMAQYEANKARSRVKGNRAKLKETTKRKATNFIDEHDAGINELRRYRKAKKSGANTSAVQAYEKAYQKTALGKAGLAYGKARTTLSKYKNTTLASIRDWNETRKNRRQNKRMDNNGGR